MKPTQTTPNQSLSVTRRKFLKDSSIAGAAIAAPSLLSMTGEVRGSDTIKVGVIGCGGRGTGAALNILQAGTNVIYPPPRNGWHTEDAVPGAKIGAKGVEVVALADLFQDRLDHCRKQLDLVGNKVKDENCFVGFNARQKLLKLPDVNYVILATPPHFRPQELRDAVDAGKHVFMEKPVAVDAPGIRSVLDSGRIAADKGLGILAGTQRRHDASQIEIVKRLHQGSIGEIFEARAYFNIGEIWMIPQETGWGEMAWQIRNWNYFTWLSGDILVEQHIHMVDLVNWIMGSHPVKAYGMGGRLARPGREYGNIYDHFAIEYEYANGARFFSQNRQIEGCTNRISAAVRGLKGTSDCAQSIKGETEWRWSGQVRNPYEQEHIDLIDSIRAGKPINEAQQVAESTLTALMGRESAYSGKEIAWEAALNAKRDYTPDTYHFGDCNFPETPTPRNYEFY